MDRSEIINVKKENAAISCILTNPELMYDSDLMIDEFHNPLARDIFAVLDKISKSAEKKDGFLDFSPVHIEQIGKENGINVKIDDVRDLRSCTGVDGTVQLESFHSYIQDIKDTNVRLRLFDASEEAKKFATDITINVEEAIAKAENAIISVEDSAHSLSEPRQIEAGGDEQMEECDTRATTGLEPGVSTGFRRFDEATGGLRPNSLTVFAARAKTGKSLIAINIAWNVFKKYGKTVPILYLDTEMSTEEQRLRLWGIASGINYRNIESGVLTEVEKQRVRDARKQTADMPLYHLYMPAFSPETLIRLCRKMKNKFGIGLIIFDYIKLPDDSILKSQQEWQALGFLTNALKNRIAGHLKIPVLTFAQLNRSGVEQAQRGEPDESSVGASDRISQYCSTLAIFRKANEAELGGAFGDQAPEWKRYGRMGNRFMHIKLTRNGGDDADPIPMFLDSRDVSLRESGDIKLESGGKTLSETISDQLARQTNRSVETES